MPGCGPPKRNKKHGDTIISKVLCDLHFSLNLVPKSADKWFTGMLIHLRIYKRFLLLQLVFNFIHNLTGCWLGDFDMIFITWFLNTNLNEMYSGADKSLARPGRKQATATEDFDVHISYL